MHRNELDFILESMLDASDDVSDINLTPEKPLQIECVGQLTPVELAPPIERLTPFQTESMAFSLVSGNHRLMDSLLKTGSCDLSYSLGDRARFRVNIFSRRGNFSIVLRKLNTEIPSLTGLATPPIFKKVPHEKTGLILVTGATGSGKSTTLAAMLNELNESSAIHIITLEDPVEFVHPQKTATFNQREMGNDFDSYASGLRSALRQAPKVILVGEMRDRETVEVGLRAAETGHLVMSTLHTIDAGQTINRILGMFEDTEQEQIRARLADTLRWIVGQRLVPTVEGKRTAIHEIMGNNIRIYESIVKGESEGKSFYEIISSNETFGWKTFDMSCLDLYEKGQITEETALQYCSKKGPVSRGIDNIKKERGEITSDISGLNMKRVAPPPPPAGAAAASGIGLKTNGSDDSGDSSGKITLKLR